MTEAEQHGIDGFERDGSGRDGRGPFPWGRAAALAACALLGLVGFIVGLAGGEPHRAWSVYLANFLFWTGLSLGAVAFVAVTNVTRARWAPPFRPAAAALAAFLPAAVILFAVLVPGLGHVLPWISHAPQSRAWWLDLPFLAARNFLGLMALSVLGLVLVRKSLDRRGAPSPRLSILFLLAYVVVMSVTAVDLVLSANPNWMNTLYPAHYFVGSFCLGLAAVLFLSASGPPPLPRAGRIRDLSNLTLGFALFTGYLFYTQVLVIWYGNLPMETEFLIRRSASSFLAAASAGIVVLSFAVPLFVVPLAKVKANPRAMSVVALVIASGLWIERFVVSVPSARNDAAFPLGFVEIAVTAGFLGIAGLSVVTIGRVLARSGGRGAVEETGEGDGS